VKNDKEETKEYFERNALLVFTIISSGLLLDWFSVKMLLDVNPWGTATAIPALVITLQGLWLIVNPYAVVYENRFEIKQSLLYNKEFFYLDAKSVSNKNSKSINIVYNDGDLESISLMGMRGSEKQKFKEKISEKIEISLQNRDF
jgi:hypothetical protein